MSFIGTNGGNRTTSQALSTYASAQPKIPQVGLHTSEFPAGHLLIALWLFINSRTDHGSYHGGADARGGRNQYAPWSWYTWHAPAINPWAAGLVANCRSDEWDRIGKEWRDNLIKGLAWMAHQYSRWCVAQGLGPVPPVRLTAAQARARHHGFVYHGALQSDRTDPTGPRNVFPWDEFIREYIRLETQANLQEVIMSNPLHEEHSSLIPDGGKRSLARMIVTTEANAWYARRSAEAGRLDQTALSLVSGAQRALITMIRYIEKNTRDTAVTVNALEKGLERGLGKLSPEAQAEFREVIREELEKANRLDIQSVAEQLTVAVKEG